MELATEDSPRKSITFSSSSPDFEFWMVGNNPSFPPPPQLLTADELFVDGVLLPLHLLSLSEPNGPPPPSPPPLPPLPPGDSTPPPPPPPLTFYKKLKDIYKVGERRRERKERRGSVGSNAELNINIWPFSRSRSAGNGGGIGSWSRAKSAAIAGRKASSAPCSRSNSHGESSKPPPPGTAAAAASTMLRRWAGGHPGRLGFNAGGGIHLGRAGPVWRLRRGSKSLETKEKRDDGSGGEAKKGGGGGGGGVRLLSLRVNTCSGGVGGGGNGRVFNLKTMFSKKVY